MKLITGVVFNCELVPYFIEHYKKLGVTEILCILNVHENKNIAAQIEKMSYNTIFKIVKIVNETDSFVLNANTMEEIKNKFIQQDEWFMVADLDEFHEYIKPIPEMISFAEEEKANCVIGHFLDRISSDGSLPSLDYSKTLDEQFPLGCQLTKNKLRGNNRKLMILKGHNLRIFRGFHYSHNERSSSLNKNIVHHFKWSNIAKEITSYKNKNYCRQYVASAFNYLFRKKSLSFDNQCDRDCANIHQKTLKYIKQNIDLTDPELNLKIIYKKK